MSLGKVKKKFRNSWSMFSFSWDKLANQTYLFNVNFFKKDIWR